MFQQRCHMSQCFHKTIPSCASAFSNTEEGYECCGMHDETHQVTRCEKQKVDLTTLRASTDDFIKKLPVHHFCVQKCPHQHSFPPLPLSLSG